MPEQRQADAEASNLPVEVEIDGTDKTETVHVDPPEPITEVDHPDEFSEHLGLDPRYEPVVMEPVSGYGPLIDAWVRMKYPLNVDEDGTHGVVQGLGNRHARQYPDGSGAYETDAQSELYAVRTADGTILWNEKEWWGWNSTAQDEVEQQIAIPFQFVGEVVTRQTGLHMAPEGATLLGMGRIGDLDGGENIVEGNRFMRGVTMADVFEDGDDVGVLLEHDNGCQVYVGFDSTSHGEGIFGFVPFDGSEGLRVPTARDALDLLRPDEAMAAETRQGEWFLVEIDDAKEFKGTIQKPGVGSTPYGASPLDESHVPRDWKTKRDDLEFVRRVSQAVDGEGVDWSDSPQDVFRKVEAGEIGLTYEEARDLAGGVAVRGTVRHRRGDHYVENLGDEWHQPVTHDYEVLSIDDATQRIHVDG